MAIIKLNKAEIDMLKTAVTQFNNTGHSEKSQMFREIAHKLLTNLNKAAGVKIEIAS